ncbi:MAG: hypothetical protein CMQ05_01905 [Gammaproteobacteria bacterium]|uniref:Phytanoyl-CoA dioxygenase n=1 Tax=OM182 bacterium MED-G24 TaxID=1986255 RepID=A0A2A5WYR8_9GAMM|nr:hypothetical protein [Gammaproteobacteria bacterium]PDH41700.1 MAG: hypothetical protein CNE99_01360 [OM182 bacterium MED-G24]RPG26635.1 MAG: hypothetical protein CBC10_003690 [Gammaproteobacteria bacterium TMED50]|tara:strand:+ start:596 stop:1729 length:1134 start_codon:yes stop_codon:yes gene_type:complete
MVTKLTLEQKKQLFHDGYIVLKGVVSDELVSTAQARIKAAKRGESLAPAEELTDLVNRSSVTPILTEAMGTFDPPSMVHVGVTKQSQPADYFTPLGYREKDLPYFGHGMHAEGLCTMTPPQERWEGTPEEIYQRMIAAGPKGDIGRTADVIGSNTDPLFQDPDMTLSVGSFSAFVIVPLNDQMADGVGQTAVVPGGHRVLEAFYRWQFETAGKVGPEGPGWPRFDTNAENGAGHVYLPDAVQEKLMEMDSETPETTPDGRPWPRPTPIKMEPGDVAITIFQMPHTGTRNQFGTESRKNMIYRIRNKRRQPNHVVTGVSDHPDRGAFGEWLEYEEGNDPWARSKHALTHMWDEWEGMQDVVAGETPNLDPIDFSHVQH